MVHARPPALTPPSPVFGPVEAAQALGVSVSYIDKLRVRGIARPTIPKGNSGRMLYSVDDLRRLAAAIGRDIDHDEPREAA